MNRPLRKKLRLPTKGRLISAFNKAKSHKHHIPSALSFVAVSTFKDAFSSWKMAGALAVAIIVPGGMAAWFAVRLKMYFDTCRTQPLKPANQNTPAPHAAPIKTPRANRK